MTKWEEFEIECTQFLNQNFGNYAQFVHQGSSNSTIPDIEVITKTGKRFYVETKQCPAQCGQFVLLPNIQTSKFDYSPLNITGLNKNSSAIIEHMNNNFFEFKEAGTRGKNIVFPNCENIFANWIVDMYRKKNVKFIITNNHTIFPLDCFLQYFAITAKYRIKRSGSNNVGNKYIEKVKSYITCNFSMAQVQQSDEKLFVYSNENLHNNRFVIEGIEYMIARRNGCFEVRRLSNTFNANVIFSIVLKNAKQGMSADEFISSLI